MSKCDCGCESCPAAAEFVAVSPEYAGRKRKGRLLPERKRPKLWARIVAGVIVGLIVGAVCSAVAAGLVSLWVAVARFAGWS